MFSQVAINIYIRLIIEALIIIVGVKTVTNCNFMKDINFFLAIQNFLQLYLDM